MEKFCPLMTKRSVGYYKGMEVSDLDYVACDENCGFFDTAYERCSLVSIASSLRDIEVRVEEVGIRK